MTELWKLPAREIAHQVAAREISATEVARDSLARLAAINPLLNAVIGVDADPAVHMHRGMRDPVSGLGGPERGGTHVDVGRQILRDAGNPLVELVDTMDDAARRVAQLAAQGA